MQKGVLRRRIGLSVVNEIIYSEDGAVVFPPDNIAHSVNRSVIIASNNVCAPFDYSEVVSFQDVVIPTNSAAIIAKNSIAGTIYAFVRAARKTDNAVADVVNGRINHGNGRRRRHDGNGSRWRFGCNAVVGFVRARTIRRMVPGRRRPLSRCRFEDDCTIRLDSAFAFFAHSNVTIVLICVLFHWAVKKIDNVCND